MQVFEPGDVVRLKSYGPKMTVVAGHLNGTVFECIWITENKVMSVQIPEPCLERVKEEPVEQVRVKGKA